MGIENTEPLPQKNGGELNEDEFIVESYSARPRLFWMMFLFFLSVVVLFWAITSLFRESMEEQFKKKPFLRVTNREISLFLWQFPEYMPQHVQEKTGYLPAFNFKERLGVEVEDADKYVQAPPELLFLYHTFARLLKGDYIPRPISRGEFLEFLKKQPEWRPENWSEAPPAYALWLNNIRHFEGDNLDNLPTEAFPIEVRRAFQGWKNYTMEGESINTLRVSYSQLEKFLSLFPRYRRNYWQNIAAPRYPKYLISYTSGSFTPSEEVPKEEITPFLRVALFNFIQSEKG